MFLPFLPFAPMPLSFKAQKGSEKGAIVLVVLFGHESSVRAEVNATAFSNGAVDIDPEPIASFWMGPGWGGLAKPKVVSNSVCREACFGENWGVAKVEVQLAPPLAFVPKTGAVFPLMDFSIHYEMTNQGTTSTSKFPWLQADFQLPRVSEARKFD